MTVTSNSAEIVQKLVSYVVLKNESIKKTIDERTRLAGGGLLDSLAMLELVEFIEREFSANFDIEDLTEANFETIGTVARLVATNIAAKNTSKNGASADE